MIVGGVSHGGNLSGLIFFIATLPLASIPSDLYICLVIYHVDLKPPVIAFEGLFSITGVIPITYLSFSFLGFILKISYFPFLLTLISIFLPF